MLLYLFIIITHEQIKESKISNEATFNEVTFNQIK